MEAKPTDLNISETTIVGDVILGNIDPQLLTKDQFNNSQDLLHHGTGKEFEFSPGEIFNKSNVTDASSDYGFGFYVTPETDQAKIYSRARGATKETAIVYDFLPYQAKMLDVRNKNNLDNNGALPKQIVLDWIDYLKEYIETDEKLLSEGDFFREIIISGIQETFINRVENAINENKHLVIRQTNENDGIFFYDKNGLIDGVFHDFMLSKGYDGMIYIESGEDEKEKRYNFTSMVFYNPKVIDTHEGWQKRKMI